MKTGKRPWIVGVSGGPDSVFLLHRSLRNERRLIAGHLNHGWRGEESNRDRLFVEEMASRIGIAAITAAARRTPKGSAERLPGEAKARDLRRSFLQNLKEEAGAEKILLGHTADDQVETILMRMLKGAGVSGMKGIPRRSTDGIERPLLDTWRAEILSYLRKRKIPFRVDKSNFDTRFERNWIRHVLIPMLEKRYGKAVKKRIFALGERFREIDEFLEVAARRWMNRNVKEEKPEGRRAARKQAGAEVRLRFQRKPYGALPAALRKKILQLACFERIGAAPNERLLESMDRLIESGGSSSRLNVGKGAVLRNRYDAAILEGARHGKAPEPKRGPEGAPLGAEFRLVERECIGSASLKKVTQGERSAVFDADSIAAPVNVRPLRAGDRMRPFGLNAEKKVKEILIDRKVPREERWGRPVVCDADGRILWIPGVVRSVHAPVTGETRRMVVFKIARRRAPTPR